MKMSERTRALEFLKKHVIGKAVVAPPITTHTDRDRLASAYEEDAVFSNLAETAHGFSFDMTVLARGTRYVAGPNGQKLLAEGTLNAVRVLRYELTERRSTGKLVGFSRFISTTNAEPDPFVGTTFLVRMMTDNGGLTVQETQIGYADLVLADGSIKPFALDGKYSYALERGELVIRYEQRTFDVDPDTLLRTPTADKFPIQVSHEIQFPHPLDAGQASPP